MRGGAGQFIVGELERDARAEGTPSRVAWAIMLAPWVGAGLLALTVLDRGVYYWLVDEDHLLEWGQFLLDAVAGIVAAMCVRPLWRDGNRAMAVLVALLALFCLFVAGEEISWGQRIFGFATPLDLATVNNQDEFNLHNITHGFSIQKVFNFVQVLAGIVGGVLPWLTRVENPRIPSEFWRLASPALFLTSSFLIVGLYRVVRFAVPSTEQVSVAVKFGEWPELCLAFGLAAYVVMLYRSQRKLGKEPLRSSVGTEVPRAPAD